jgi:cytochrome b6
MSFEPLRRHFRGKSIQIHSRWSLFGVLTLFFFLVQAISGILLSLYYQPSIETAYRSVSRIVGEVPFGWFVRSVHIWSSHLLILSALVHLSSKYFLRSYRNSHWSAWSSGVLLVLILSAFAFTGHLLPWDVTGYYATQIGTDIAAAAPVVGSFLAGVLRPGSDYVDGATLSRIASIHTVVLPCIAFLTMLLFVVAKLFGDSSLPEAPPVRGGQSFYPYFAYRGALASLAGLMLVFTLAMWFPVLMRPEANPLAAPPPGIRPEWYFLPVYQAIRLLPGSIGGVATERYLDVFLFLSAAILLALPWIDRGNGRVARVIGTVFLVYALCAILLTFY